MTSDKAPAESSAPTVTSLEPARLRDVVRSISRWGLEREVRLAAGSLVGPGLASGEAAAA